MQLAGEEAIDESDLVANKQPKTETEEARTHHEATVEPCEFIAGKGKGESQSRSNQHHSRDRADAEDEQVEDRPLRLTNCAQDEQGNGRGTGQAVHDADE